MVMAPHEQALRDVDEEIEGDNSVYGTVPEVVDPEVRAYVYSLVSAVSTPRLPLLSTSDPI